MVPLTTDATETDRASLLKGHAEERNRTNLTSKHKEGEYATLGDPQQPHRETAPSSNFGRPAAAKGKRPPKGKQAEQKQEREKPNNEPKKGGGREERKKARAQTKQPNKQKKGPTADQTTRDTKRGESREQRALA